MKPKFFAFSSGGNDSVARLRVGLEKGVLAVGDDQHGTRSAPAPANLRRPDLAGLTRDQLITRICSLEEQLDRAARVDGSWRVLAERLGLGALEAAVVMVLQDSPSAFKDLESLVSRVWGHPAARSHSTAPRTIGTVQQLIYQINRKLPGLIDHPVIALTPYGREMVERALGAKPGT